MNEKWNNTFRALMNTRFSPVLECTCKVLPQNVKQYIREQYGAEVLSWIVGAIRCKRWIILTGPPTTGKTTIKNILWSLGYPFVVDEGDMGYVIHISDKVQGELKCTDDILEELEID